MLLQINEPFNYFESTDSRKKIISLYFQCHCVENSQIMLLEKANKSMIKISKSENVHLYFYTPDELHVPT